MTVLVLVLSLSLLLSLLLLLLLLLLSTRRDGVWTIASSDLSSHSKVSFRNAGFEEVGSSWWRQTFRCLFQCFWNYTPCGHNARWGLSGHANALIHLETSTLQNFPNLGLMLHSLLFQRTFNISISPIYVQTTLRRRVDIKLVFLCHKSVRMSPIGLEALATVTRPLIWYSIM